MSSLDLEPLSTLVDPFTSHFSVHKSVTGHRELSGSKLSFYWVFSSNSLVGLCIHYTSHYSPFGSFPEQHSFHNTSSYNAGRLYSSFCSYFSLGNLKDCTLSNVFGLNSIHSFLTWTPLSLSYTLLFSPFSPFPDSHLFLDHTVFTSSSTRPPQSIKNPVNKHLSIK